MAKKWPAWCVVDVHECMVVTAVWRPTNNPYECDTHGMNHVLNRSIPKMLVCEDESRIERDM